MNAATTPQDLSPRIAELLAHLEAARAAYDALQPEVDAAEARMRELLERAGVPEWDGHPCDEPDEPRLQRQRASADAGLDDAYARSEALAHVFLDARRDLFAEPARTPGDVALKLRLLAGDDLEGRRLDDDVHQTLIEAHELLGRAAA